jgi:hypothetical protein
MNRGNRWYLFVREVAFSFYDEDPVEEDVLMQEYMRLRKPGHVVGLFVLHLAPKYECLAFRNSRRRSSLSHECWNCQKKSMSALLNANALNVELKSATHK